MLMMEKLIGHHVLALKKSKGHIFSAKKTFILMYTNLKF